MRSAMVVGSIAAVLLCGASTAQAGFIVEHDGANATGILNLDVGGMLYDVVFEFGSAEEVYGGLPPIFDFNSGDDAFDAVVAANDALNTVPEVMTVGPMTSDMFNVGYEWDIPFVAFQGSAYGDGAGLWANFGTDLINDGDPATWALFTPVPAPGTMGVFGLLLVTSGRRRKRRSRE